MMMIGRMKQKKSRNMKYDFQLNDERDRIEMKRLFERDKFTFRAQIKEKHFAFNLCYDDFLSHSFIPFESLCLSLFMLSTQTQIK
jgi:IS4 transposase